MKLVKSNNPRVKVFFSRTRKMLAAPKSDENIKYEDVSVENALQEHGFGPEASKAARRNAMSIADEMVGLT